MVLLPYLFPSFRQSGTQSSEFSTIQAAVYSLGSRWSARTIFVYPGTYREQVSIQYKGPLIIFGSTTNTANWSSNTVTLTNNKNAADSGGNDPSATLRALSQDFKLYNVNVANTFGGQALAISARGTRQVYYGCEITGDQDTLFAHAGNGVQHYAYCWIEGSVDFIFGRTSACDPVHHVFDRVKLVSTGANLKNKVMLGRPWRVLARTTWQNSHLGDLVHPDEYSTMAANAIPVYMEYGNTGSSADTSKRKYFTKTSAAHDWRQWRWHRTTTNNKPTTDCVPPYGDSAVDQAG
ncbi:pectin lyase fold/virulence factor [Pterulicium gracile]|uniref:Pectinesterase n=1 Tax=Pterulicium gracile TaxID=1884261 RepID=A0A5C3QFN4_9AGAR|nr:pectin lyase fold/virulence factor [Pterula gracilis]